MSVGVAVFYFERSGDLNYQAEDEAADEDDQAQDMAGIVEGMSDQT